MRQRAMSVELIPEIEEMCMDDLVTYCTQKTGLGEEMLCLQDKYTRLSSFLPRYLLIALICYVIL